MTPEELNDALDAMQTDAGDDAGKRPGLIEVPTDEWINCVSAMQEHKPKTIADGIRIRDIKVAVGANTTTRILSRSEAGDRGEPYRDLIDRA